MYLKSQTLPAIIPPKLAGPEKPHHGMTWWEFHKAEGKRGRLPNNERQNSGGKHRTRKDRDPNRRQAIVKLLSKLGPMAAHDIADKFGIGSETCRKQCCDMVNAGILQTQREGRFSLYSVREITGTHEQSATERLRDAMQEAGE